MKPRVTHALSLLMLVALALQVTQARAQEALPVLEPVEVSGYQGEEGQGLRLAFKRVRPSPALALWTVGQAREVVAALEEEFQQATSRPGLKLLPEAHTRTMAGLPPPADPRPWRDGYERNTRRCWVRPWWSYPAL